MNSKLKRCRMGFVSSVIVEDLTMEGHFGQARHSQVSHQLVFCTSMVLKLVKCAGKVGGQTMANFYF